MFRPFSSPSCLLFKWSHHANGTSVHAHLSAVTDSSRRYRGKENKWGWAAAAAATAVLQITGWWKRGVALRRWLVKHPLVSSLLQRSRGLLLQCSASIKLALQTIHIGETRSCRTRHSVNILQITTNWRKIDNSCRYAKSSSSKLPSQQWTLQRTLSFDEGKFASHLTVQKPRAFVPH